MSMVRNILLALSLIVIAQSINVASDQEEEKKSIKIPLPAHLRAYNNHIP